MNLSQARQFAVVLPAGGLGKRFGGNLPKQLLEIQGKPLYQHVLERFLAHPMIGQVVLAVPADWLSHFEGQLAGWPVDIVVGGAERWQSVQNGVAALHPEVRWVLVHDVARPFIERSTIDAVLDQVQVSACIVAKPAIDTIKRVINGQIQSTIDRREIWLAQTPQASEVQLLKDCYAKIAEQPLDFTPTDEASILEFFGIPVHIVEGNSWNDKVTTPEDFQRFAYLLSTAKEIAT